MTTNDYGILTETEDTDTPLVLPQNLSVSAAIQKYNEESYKNWDQNVLEKCLHCERTFLPESIKFH